MVFLNEVRPMKLAMLALLVATGTACTANAQMMGSADQSSGSMSDSMQESAPSPKSPEADKAAQTFAAKPKLAFPPKVAANPEKLTPLPQRERVVQMLDRFTYGARPGEVDQVVAMGADKWLAQQLAPDTIGDDYLNKRLGDYPTLTMTAGQTSIVFPANGQVNSVADGRVPYPTDPMLNGVYEVAVAKYLEQRSRRDVNGNVIPRPDPTDAEKQAKKQASQKEASRIYGELMALNKKDRMSAILALSVPERIALTGDGNLTGDQHNLLFADFAPRERETFVAMAADQNSSGRIREELAPARVLRDVLTNRQLEQVMTNFWFNHFNIYQPKDSDQWYTTAYERDVIRKHALGSFKDLLIATAQSPAMMVYLDNWLSVGPDSLSNGIDPKNPGSKKGNKGLNENYGREVMELHTVGVNGGYSQADVTALSAILTGWGVERTNQGGGFYFDPKRHEPGTKYWYGYAITDDGQVTKLTAATPMPKITFGPGAPSYKNEGATPDSVKQGLAALTILANDPHTAHFISWLLAQYFVADNPPPALVDRLSKTYLTSGGDIKTMLRAIIASPEFNSRQYFHNKVKTPEEFLASAFRTTSTVPSNPSAVANRIGQMGEPLYNALPPTGYYLTAEQWMSAVALVDRLNFSYDLVTGRFAGQTFDAPKLLALGMMAPSGSLELVIPAPGPKPASTVPDEKQPQAKMIGFASAQQQQPTSKPAPAPGATPGAQATMRVLESTVIGAPVSAQTNMLISKQLNQQPAGANPVDTLNLMTALVLGSPEFQLR
jgi:uncharacterized protein (DUF1800 family)